MDPLTSLREFTIRGELDRIVRSGDLLFFGDPSSSSSLSLPAAAETAYRSKQGSQYTLETLLFFLKHANLKHTDYLQLARSHRLPAVTFTDRKPLLDYLHGRTSSSDQILQFQTQPSSQFNPINNTQFPDSSAVAGNSLPEEPSAKKIRVPEKVTYLDTIKHLERPLKDRDSLLENRNRDFYSLLAAAASSNRKKDEERYRRDKENGGEEFSGLKTAKFMGGKGGEGVPIILVPSAMQTLITIYNVKEFLEDGVFVPTEVKVKQMREMKAGKPECVTVQKKLSRGDRGKAVAAYEVRDKPSGMKAEDWERVVAVFVLGKEWQFKDWPFKDHVEIFNKIIGFFMRFEDDSVESAKTVKQWNVKIISISKNKRHQDRAAALEVWDRLEEFVRSRSHS